jgi:hypothetical protein
VGGGPPGGRLAAARGTHIVKVESKDACKQKGSGRASGVGAGSKWPPELLPRLLVASCAPRSLTTHGCSALEPRVRLKELDESGGWCQTSRWRVAGGVNGAKTQV